MLTAIVLCHNCAEILPRCLSSLKFADCLYVIDDNSTDNSVAVAKSFSAQVVSHPLNKDFSSQRNYALSLAKSGWVLFVDADEEVPQELAQEILSRINQPGVSGYYLRRQDILWGRSLRFGDLRNFRVLRLAKKDSGKWHGQIHETWDIAGETPVLSRPLLHYPHATLYKFLHQLNNYSSIRARELFQSKGSASLFQIVAYPLGKFLKLYLWQLGFIDGVAGLVHALCMSFYTFLVRGKLYLLRQGIGEYA